LPGYMGYVIQMAAGDYPEGPLTLDVPNIHIIPKAGATVTITSGPNDGPIFDVVKGPVEIDGVTIYGTRNDDAIACDKDSQLTLDHVTVRDNPKDGLNAKGGCTVTIDRSTFARNHDSSMYFDDVTISIRNSFVFGNGNGNLTQGQISLNGHTAGEFRFNTIAFNSAKDGNGPGSPDYVAGLRCIQDKSVNASDNLFADNSPVQASWIGTNCGGNVQAQNWFGTASTVHFAGSSGPNYDLHLTSQTPNSGFTTKIRDNANTNCSDVTHDIDSDTRPQGGTACDYGADEFKP
jgi:Right handed beta helix region